MISTNICKTRSFGNDWTGLHAECDCGSSDHAHDLIMEYDDEMDKIALSLYFYTWTGNMYQYNPGVLGWFGDLWQSIKFRSRILFFGWAKVQYDFLFSNETAVQNYIDALQDTLNEQRAYKADQIRTRNAFNELHGKIVDSLMVDKQHDPTAPLVHGD